MMLEVAIRMIGLEWLGILLISAALIAGLRKTSAPFWTIGVVILIGVVMFFVLPTITSVTSESY
jgi:hypothetical protein